MIRVLLFARLADLAGVREAEFPGKEQGLLLSELLRQLAERFPALAPNLANPRLLMLAVNQEQADAERMLHSGDEVAIMPPFSGG